MAALVVVVAALAALALPLTRARWRHASDNPVRRGIVRATELGCFSCHGSGGAGGVRDPRGGEVPGWTGGAWRPLVEDAVEVRQFIRNGISDKRAGDPAARRRRQASGIRMPAYGDVLAGSDLEDLTAAFLVLSGMRAPAPGSAAARGREVAIAWGCFGCHGPAGSGGLPNPGSFTGFVPGWYGADFDELVRGRAEFDTWVGTGDLPRVAHRPVASWFLRRQKLRMPAYPALDRGERDDLWAYVQWLRASSGGAR